MGWALLSSFYSAIDGFFFAKLVLYSSLGPVDKLLRIIDNRCSPSPSVLLWVFVSSMVCLNSVFPLSPV